MFDLLETGWLTERQNEEHEPAEKRRIQKKTKREQKKEQKFTVQQYLCSEVLGL